MLMANLAAFSHGLGFLSRSAPEFPSQWIRPPNLKSGVCTDLDLDYDLLPIAGMPSSPFSLSLLQLGESNNHPGCHTCSVTNDQYSTPRTGGPQ
jgi:hypothetical protein